MILETKNYIKISTKLPPCNYSMLTSICHIKLPNSSIKLKYKHKTKEAKSWRL